MADFKNMQTLGELTRFLATHEFNKTFIAAVETFGVKEVESMRMHYIEHMHKALTNEYNEKLDYDIANISRHHDRIREKYMHLVVNILQITSNTTTYLNFESFERTSLMFSAPELLEKIAYLVAPPETKMYYKKLKRMGYA